MIVPSAVVAQIRISLEPCHLRFFLP